MLDLILCVLYYIENKTICTYLAFGLAKIWLVFRGIKAISSAGSVSLNGQFTLLRIYFVIVEIMNAMCLVEPMFAFGFWLDVGEGLQAGSFVGGALTCQSDRRTNHTVRTFGTALLCILLQRFMTSCFLWRK